MKRQIRVRRTGAVLLMILGLMSMFAISILTYMVVTSNMAETAQNSAKIDATKAMPAQSDVEAALKNVLIGSNNMRNPIGPFSILENMYGDWREYSNGSEYLAEFPAYIQIFPNLGIAAVSPVEDMYNNDLRNPNSDWTDAKSRSSMMQLFENSGGVLTFKSYSSMPDAAVGLWKADVEGTSAFVLEKVITNPTNLCYKDGSAGAYWNEHYNDRIIAFNDKNNFFPCDAWHFKIELTDDLKRFVNDLYKTDDDYNINKNFNEKEVKVNVRLNRPAYSGTGAGGFTPGEAKDATMPYQWTVNNHLRNPFAFWTNASAPDFYPFLLNDNSTKIDFRSYWAHLTDVNYDSSMLDSNGPDGMRYASELKQGWSMGVPVTSGFQDDSYLEPIRMNPTYNAPDSRTLFLAYFGGPMTLGEMPDFTPSFHRPDSFDILVNKGYLGYYESAYAGVSKDTTACLMGLIRKLTPRPLPLDHWNFDGGNDFLRYGNVKVEAQRDNKPEIDVLAQRLIGKDSGDSPVQWDVDNDGDGVREGIWIHSGLPIRVDKNGTPYATMFSYTIVDLDGRVNVNTAGNWDQLPNNLNGDVNNNRYNYPRYSDNNDDYTQPFNYLDELSGLADGSLSGVNGGITSSPGDPFYNVRNLNAGDFGWRDDHNNDQISVAVRGDGRGTSNVQLYEALSSIFGSYSSFDINTLASNLLWRRNLSLRDEPMGIVDQSGLKWETNNIMGSQPGEGNSDDSLNTRQNFFTLMNPVRLQLTEGESRDNLFSGVDDDSAVSLGEAKMIYPYRGKMTVDMNSVVSSAVYDFANTAFRSYDPLGAQIYTYAPRYSENPYQASQNALSWQDSPYTLPMFERFLRPSDADADKLPRQLVDDLHMNADIYGDPDLEKEFAAARQSLTTISSDVPSPSLVFPENIQLDDGEYRGGSFGFSALIRKCVRKELHKVFELKGVLGSDIDGNARIPVADYLDGDEVFENKVEEITAYLVSLLPPEIMAGEKIDLNALSQKNYWLDVDYDSNGNPKDSNDSDRTLHNVGLVKRMERARGLYIVLMTLLYEDMNANRLYGNDGNVAGGGAGAGGVGDDGAEDENSDEPDFQNYFEGSFDLLTFEKPGDDTTKNLMAQQLTATRIAQWCVNAIDFSDPDATMTPFFFDPTPFDGWWVYDDSWIDDSRWNPDNGGWGTDEPFIDFLFDSVNGLPGEQMNTFFRDALDQSEKANATSSTYLGPFNEVNAAGNNLCSSEYIAKWMSKKIKKLEDQTTDLGFRLIWGMERPDLVLTETLSFHDLGVADTNLEKVRDGSTPSYVQGINDNDGDDPDFDQVKRPVGSTYLELYCTANPNVPQSRELYDYDSVNGVWKLRLSKKTPIYTNRDGLPLEMPIWRVAIGASADPRGLHDSESLEGDDKTSIRNSSKVVYQKRRNSVLEWLTPKKSGEDYIDDFNFFSMQPRQFRNYPTNTLETDATALDVKNIADLDIDQGLEVVDGKAVVKDPLTGNFNDEWKSFNLSSSNILGPAVAAEYGSLADEKKLDKNPRTREIELDRIVWFSYAKGDDNNGSGLKLGSAGKYPDALRTFANAVDERVYLEPNQYLVVGPDKKRKIGSVAYNATKTDAGDEDSGNFDKDPVETSTDNWINIDNVGSNGLSDARSNFKRNYVYMVAKSNIGDRGLNISEPLWTAQNLDPYAIMPRDKDEDDDKLLMINPQEKVIDNAKYSSAKVLDVPFELPGEWSEDGTEDTRRDVVDDFYKNTVKNYPIVQDKLFGVGTVPAYKSAFVQRVADPNRPYHPLMNPYITVDWNVMDLTIFTGEGRELSKIEDQIVDKFSIDSDYSSEHSDKNGIKLAANTALNLEKDKTLSLNDAFSSRQWGNGSQKSFAPTLDSDNYTPDKRPNPWARAFKADGGRSGLEAGKQVEPASSVGQTGFSVMSYIPNHTLGMYNGAGKLGKWVQEDDANGNSKMVWKDAEPGVSDPDYQYKQLNKEYQGIDVGNLRIYKGAPRTPFEHLVWNDAPYSNPVELTMVPASAPGRFGLEFVRQESDFDLSRLYNVDPDHSKGSSLGSFGIFGFDEWYTDDNVKVPDGGGTKEDDKLKKLKKKAGRIGPYFNFFASSKKAGETLNICNLLEFVYVPSLYLGTKKLAGRDENGNLILDNNGNPIFHSRRREPGKINLNTMTKPVWQAISPNSERVSLQNRLPGTSWGDLGDSRFAFQDNYDQSGNYNGTTELYCYFQPSHTLGLWTQMNQAKAPIPSFSTILAQRECDLSKENSVNNPPILDNIMPSTDESGDLMYRYSYTDPDDPSKKISGEVVWSEIERLLNQNYDNFEYDEVRSPRNNIYEATAEMQRLSGVTTTRSNTFAVWVTVGYFEVERCLPGVNMPNVDPDGNKLTIAELTNSNYKWYNYYQAIYPDGYTYGKELGSEFGETQRHRGFSIIDRSIPVDYRRGNSSNWEDAVLIKRVID